MTATELASLLRARRVGKGKWIAKCVAHPDRNPSLSIAEGRKGIVLKCMSAGCSVESILDALGLKWADLFHGSATKEIRGRLADERKLERLLGKQSVFRFLQATDKGRERYWQAAERRVIAEMEPLYWEMMPDLERFEKVRRWELEDYRRKRMDFIGRQHVHTAGGRLGAGCQEIRQDRIHPRSHQLPHGGVPSGSQPDTQHR